MSPKKSPGQAVGQLLSESGREAVGRALDIEWANDRPHHVGTDDAPEAVLSQLSSEARARVGTEKWVWWRPCFDELCECHRPPNMEGLLDAALALEDASPADVEGFVFRHGPIASCVHLRAHDCDEPLSVELRDVMPLESDAFSSPIFWEAPTVYRSYARTFRAFLTLAADIQAGRRGDIDLWTFVVSSVPEDARWLIEDTFENALADIPGDQLKEMGQWPTVSPPEDPRAFAQMVVESGLGPDLLARTVHAFMAESPVTLGFEWPFVDEDTARQGGVIRSDAGFAARPRVRLVGSTFGILTCQLAVAIQGEIFAICSNCHQTYAPTRRPQAGRDNYCPACRDVRKAAYKRRRHQATETGDD